MNSFNPYKVTAEITKTFSAICGYIKDAESIEEMQKQGSRAVGYIEGLNAMTNGMICFANNDFTGDFNALLEDMMADVYQLCIDKALEFDRHDLFWKYAEKRDEYREMARD